jgi:recombination protein RecR
MAESPVIQRLIEALRVLPGVGPKSARRMSYYLLERNRDGAREIAAALIQAADTIGHCSRCNNLSESELCDICSSSRRDASLLCVVETPTDLQSLEQASVYSGMYFVLMGHLSPLDGIGPDELGMDRLETLLNSGDVKEVILATNLTVEGEATAHFISEMVQARGIKASRIAYGVPVGGELEYIDRNTLSRAFSGRLDL